MAQGQQPLVSIIGELPEGFARTPNTVRCEVCGHAWRLTETHLKVQTIGLTARRVLIAHAEAHGDMGKRVLQMKAKRLRQQQFGGR